MKNRDKRRWLESHGELSFVRNTYGNNKHGRWVAHGGACFLSWCSDNKSIVRDLYRRVKNCLLGKV